jgi:hypothetical protein
MCQGFYTGPGVSRYQYCHDAARADNKAACDAASTCCDWVLPDPDVNTATMDAREYCDKLNDKMAPFPIDQHADICTKTTCCRMVTEQDQNGVQQTTCQSKLPVGTRCEGSCSAKDSNNNGFADASENQATCPLGTGQPQPCELVLDTASNTCVDNPTNMDYYERNSWGRPSSQLVAGAGQVTNGDMSQPLCETRIELDQNGNQQTTQRCTANEYCNYAQTRVCNSCVGLATKDDCALLGLSAQGVTECKTMCFANGPGPPGACKRA